jgi:hypothetical protein
MAETTQAGKLKIIINGATTLIHPETVGDQVLMDGNTNVQAEVDALKAALGAQVRVYVRDDIDGRDALTGLNAGDRCFVLDATDDTTVASGGAEYLYTDDDPEWIKISEAESMDLVLSWSNISGKPTSTTTAIDSAVTASHSHSNKTVLDKLAEGSNGLPTYAGEQIGGVRVVSSLPGGAPDGLYFVTTEGE